MVLLFYFTTHLGRYYFYLAVMDSTAASLCKDNNLPILVFSIEDPENIYKAVCGENIGTIVTANN